MMSFILRVQRAMRACLRPHQEADTSRHDLHVCTRATVSMRLSARQHHRRVLRALLHTISIAERGENHGEQAFVPSEHEHTPNTVSLGESLLTVAGPRAPRRSHGHYGAYVPCTVGKL